jgi:hypothetical protein
MPIKGQCHCGATQFEVSEAPASVTRCTCTFCSKRGTLTAYYPPEQFKVLNGRDQVHYSRNGFIRHYHCGICGCTLYSDSPEWVDFQPHPTRRKMCVNARLFEDFDLAAIPVEVIDGKNLW